MTRVCIIGDSHLGALKYGIDTTPSEFEMTTFACRNDDVADLRLRGRSLASENVHVKAQLARFSGGRTAIEIDDYDQFIIVGFNFCLVPVGFVYKNYRSDGMCGAPDDRYLLSDDCFAAVCRSALGLCDGIRIGIAIRSITEAPIILVASPNMAEGLDEAEIPSWFPPLHRAEREGDGEFLLKTFRDAWREISGVHGFLDVLPMKETSAKSLFNQAKFSLLSEKKEVSSGDDKIARSLHGNHLYGSILASHVFGEIRKSMTLREDD